MALEEKSVVVLGTLYYERVSELYILNTTVIMCKCSSIILESGYVTSTVSVDLPTFLQK